LLGLVRRLFREDDARLRIVIALALVALGIQVGAVYWTYFRLATGAQGRHLFPCLVPALVLMWIGVESLPPVQYRRYAALGLVAVLALLDTAFWGLVVVPAYAS
jgi:hypothetical protein